MESNRVSDFSIERILGHKPAPVMTELTADIRYLQGGYIPAPLHHPPPHPPHPLPHPGCLQCRLSFTDSFPYGSGFHPEIYQSSGGLVQFNASDAQLLPGYHGYHHHQAAGDVSAQSQLRQKARMRTVFTDSQTKQLEALFDLTDYPAVEARAEVARNTGLSEETVRVWFKNRRARRKRQHSGSKVKSPSPSPCITAEKKHFATFL